MATCIRVARFSGLLGLYLLAVQALAWAIPGAWTALREAGPLRPEAAVEAAATLAAAACLLWWGLAFTVTVLGALPGALGRAATRLAALITPAAVRRITRYALGATLAAGTAAGSTAPAAALPTTVHPTAGPAAAGPVTAGPVTEGPITGHPTPGPERIGRPIAATDPSLPDLDRPATATAAGTERAGTPSPAGSKVAKDQPDTRQSERSSAHPVATQYRPELSSDCLPVREADPSSAGRPGRPGAQVTVSVTVRAGDTLWDLAAAHLPPTASAARIGAEWPRWYRLNADVVGSDPDLIRPGQRLIPPGHTFEETR